MYIAEYSLRCRRLRELGKNDEIRLTNSITAPLWVIDDYTWMCLNKQPFIKIHSFKNPNRIKYIDRNRRVYTED